MTFENFLYVLLNLSFMSMMMGFMPSLAFAMANSTTSKGGPAWPMLLPDGRMRF